MKLFNEMIDYIREHPYEAIGVIIAVYILFIIFILPITQLHIIVAFAYCKVYHSFWIGFAVATPIIFVGVMLGALFAFLLSVYLFASYIKRKLRKSKSDFAEKFRIVDKMFETDGILLVALFRLMFLPFGLTCYILGVTQVSLVDYLIGSTAYLIKIIFCVILGCSLYQASEQAELEGADGPAAEQDR